MYDVPYPVCNGYGDGDQNCRERDLLSQAKDVLNFQLPIRPYGDNNDPYTDKMGPINQQTSQDANSRRGDPINSWNSNLMLGKVV